MLLLLVSDSKYKQLLFDY